MAPINKENMLIEKPTSPYPKDFSRKKDLSQSCLHENCTAKTNQMEKGLSRQNDALELT